MKRICILMLSLVILFASYSCAKNSGTGPKGKEYTLKLAVDYYGTGAIDSSAISVKVYKTKEDVESEKVESEYTGLDFADETKPVSIIENYEVVITLNKTLDGDSTYISGDVPDEFDSTSGELQFTMDGDKTFSIIFSKDKIELYSFEFESSVGGQIEISVIENGGDVLSNKIVKAGVPSGIKMLKNKFSDHTIKMKAVADGGYIFDGWDGINEATEEITLTKEMSGTSIRSKFREATQITLTLEAGTGGSIKVETVKDGTVIKTTTIDSGSKEPITIGELELGADYTITASATGESGYIFDGWDGIADVTSDNFTITKEYDNKKIKANFLSAETLAITFEAQTGGTIDVSVVRDSDGATVQTASISSKTETIQIAKSRFTGHTIKATATANSGYSFTTWGGEASGSQKTVAITSSMAGKTITASFSEEKYSFIFKSGDGGTIAISIAKSGTSTENISVSSGDNKTVEIAKNKFVSGNGYTITVKATADSSHSFLNWTGVTSTTDNFVLTSSMASKTISAFFEDVLNFNFAISGSGTISVDITNSSGAHVKSATISSASGTFSVARSMVVTNTMKATANPNSGYLFDKWSYNSSKDNPLIITSAMAGTITANFIVISSVTITFRSGANGDIYLNFYNSSDGKMISNKIIAANTSGSTTLTSSLLTSQKVKARAVGNFVNPDYYVIDKWSDNSTSEVREINLSSPTTLSVIFKTGTIDYGEGIEPTQNRNWYGIWNREHLIYVANQVNAADQDFTTGKYRLMDNIDYGGGYHLPIGFDGATFDGIIDGNNKTIKNAKFGKLGSSSRYTGFIGYLGENGVVSNLIIDSSCTIDSSADYVGSIAGRSDGSIYNSVNKADVNYDSSTFIGGIVGIASGIISNVYNTGNIDVDLDGNICIGGVVGVSYKTTYLKNAYNTGNITCKGRSTSSEIGGVIGKTGGSSLYIINVYNTGTINLGSSTATKYTGGVFGRASSSFTFQATNVYFTGSTSLPDTGFGSDSDRKSDANVVGKPENNSLSGLESTFNKAIPNSWEAGPNRPVLVGLPE